MTEKNNCFLCDSDLGDRPEDHWCYGCKKYICDMHSDMFGRHRPEEHDEEEDY